MGLDAPSTDLTARIQARRRALVRAGEVEARLPGEHMIHGTQPGAHDRYEAKSDALSVANERRAHRAVQSEEVVEMDYTDYSNPDADEPFEVTGEEEPPEDSPSPAPEPPTPTPEDDEPEPEPEPEPEQSDIDPHEFAVRALVSDTDVEYAILQVEARLMALDHNMNERFDALERGLLALAGAITVELQHVNAGLEELKPKPEPEPVVIPSVTVPKYGAGGTTPRKRTLWSFLSFS